MCGRFVQAYSWQEIEELLDLDFAPQNLQPRYNVAPTQHIDVVYRDEDELVFARMRWGLIPFWWKNPASEAPSTFNARAETVAEKPFFRAAYNKTRCIIPASGFYEWVDRGKGQPKQPHYICARDEKPLLFAGLWSHWKDVETEEERLTATIIVTKANETLADIHDRMPVILDPDDVKPWLNGALGSELLEPAPEERLTYWPVSKRVNKAGSADDRSLIEPIAAG